MPAQPENNESSSNAQRNGANRNRNVAIYDPEPGVDMLYSIEVSLRFMRMQLAEAMRHQAAIQDQVIRLERMREAELRLRNQQNRQNQ
ncbi:hypothetical protein CAEBREN_23812 [Caenorhabditis brenneri]|uniref:Uncharacterized protein n=1 Tax=Caenorhabditis brenneri TaxID=135651 RepID=G0MHQ2_CAEBE|nr:hypothetical protein CAEBREN_23812 [Caenorhabditis brenneri]